MVSRYSEHKSGLGQDAELESPMRETNLFRPGLALVERIMKVHWGRDNMHGVAAVNGVTLNYTI